MGPISRKRTPSTSCAAGWPGCAPDLTEEITIGLRLSQALYNLQTAATFEELRVGANEAMGEAFEEADFIVAATNPGPAFPAEATMSSSEDSFVDWARRSDVARALFRGTLFGVRVATALAPKLPGFLLDQANRRFADLFTMGSLTMISNIYGNPAVSIPAGTVDDLPVGMQVLGRHHQDALLFDVALAFEREHPWPMVAPTAVREPFQHRAR